MKFIAKFFLYFILAAILFTMIGKGFVNNPKFSEIFENGVMYIVVFGIAYFWFLPSIREFYSIYIRKPDITEQNSDTSPSASSDKHEDTASNDNN